MTQQNLWMLLIFFGLSALSWVVGKMREQATIRKQKEEARQRYEEQLRTGRDAEPGPQRTVSPQTPVPADLAERRQAQLRELRRQQQGRTSASPPIVVARPAPQSRVRTIPGGVVIQRGPGSPQRPQAPATRPAKRPASSKNDPLASPWLALDQRRQAEQSERERIAREAEARETQQVRLEAAQRRAPVPVEDDAPESPASARHRRGMGVRELLVPGPSRQRPADLQRLFALSEVLGRPVSLRD